MNEKKILGYRKFNSKAGKPFCIITTIEPYSDREIEHGACGNKSEDVFLPEELHDKITLQCVGKMAVIDYTVSGGKAYVKGITIK